MEYPAIVYSRDSMHIDHASNSPYRHLDRYSVIVIDRDPSSNIPRKIAEFPQVRFDRAFSKDGLHHTAFVLYF